MNRTWSRTGVAALAMTGLIVAGTAGSGGPGPGRRIYDDRGEHGGDEGGGGGVERQEEDYRQVRVQRQEREDRRRRGPHHHAGQVGLVRDHRGGGFLGMGKHDVAIPVGQLKENQGKIVLAGATKDALKASEV